MDTKHREYVWKIGLVLLVILCVFFIVKTINEVKASAYIGGNVVAKNVIHVTGEGKVLAKPDIATFTFSLQSEAKVVSDAQKIVSDSSDKVLQFLKTKLNIDEKDIQTTSYNIYPRYIYPQYPIAGKNDRTLAGYDVSQSVSIKLRDVSKSGQLLSGIGTLGVTDISGPTFTIDKIADVQKEARAKAIADAKINAEKLAQDLGVQLVRIVDFSETTNNPGPIMYAKAAATGYGMGVGGATTDSSITTGQNEISSQVSVTYEIQ